MKKISFTILIVVLLIGKVSAQSSKGVNWTDGLTFDQVLKQAQVQNKGIFVDCFATWCIPCKTMDKEVYTSDSVGNYINTHFLAVRIQFDTTKNDSEDVKRWREIADTFKNEYNINSFPTYLFFSSSGKILHKDVGLKSINDFMKVMRAANDSKSQFYTLLLGFEQQTLSFKDYPKLVKEASSIGENDLAKKIANAYVENYLLKQIDQEELFSQQNLQFMAMNISKTTNRSFDVFFRNPAKVDSAMKRKGYAQSIIDFAIYKEFVTPILKISDDKNPPNWTLGEREIQRKFGGQLAHKITLTGKINWFIQKQKWSQLLPYYFEKLDKYGTDTTSYLAEMGLNNTIWDAVFLNSNNPRYIQTALSYIKGLIERHPENPTFRDTYANLLYKKGDRKKALENERVAISLNPKDDSLKETYEKMKRNQKTW